LFVPLFALFIPIGTWVAGEGLAELFLKQRQSGTLLEQRWRDAEILEVYRALYQGWLIFGVSNQGGVAHNIKTPQQEMEEIDTTLALFQRNPFHIVKTCWYHNGPKARHPIFKHRSLFRKPDIGMLAMCEFEAFNAGLIVDWDLSVFVGDRPEDEECAKRAGIDFEWAWDFFGRQRPAEETRK
jgi:D-glycero-D-manno-heptose 1,7-bisphosphate phosphatase